MDISSKEKAGRPSKEKAGRPWKKNKVTLENTVARPAKRTKSLWGDSGPARLKNNRFHKECCDSHQEERILAAGLPWLARAPILYMYSCITEMFSARNLITFLAPINVEIESAIFKNTCSDNAVSNAVLYQPNIKTTSSTNVKTTSSDNPMSKPRALTTQCQKHVIYQPIVKTKNSSQKKQSPSTETTARLPTKQRAGPLKTQLLSLRTGPLLL